MVTGIHFPVLSSVQPGLSWHTVGINMSALDGCTYPRILSLFPNAHFKYGALCFRYTLFHVCLELISTLFSGLHFTS